MYGSSPTLVCITAAFPPVRVQYGLLNNRILQLIPPRSAAEIRSNRERIVSSQGSGEVNTQQRIAEWHKRVAAMPPHTVSELGVK